NAAEPRGESRAVRQRMAALVRRRPARQIAVEVRIARTGNMRLRVGRRPRIGVRQREPAVDGDPAGLAETPGERVGLDQGKYRHSRPTPSSAELCESRFGRADPELAGRLDVELLDDAVFDDHREALAAH